MLKNLFATLFMLLLVATSCEKADLITNGTDVTLTKRTSTGITVTIKTVGGELVTMPATSLNVTGMTAVTFAVTVFTESGSGITYTATALTATQNESNLRITKDGGTIIYTGKSLVNVDALGAGTVLVKINPGAIVTTAGSLIADDEEGF